MCTRSCIDFVAASLAPAEVEGRSVLEVGALDVNGSVRPTVEALGPGSYLGVDLQAGPGVDEVCDVAALVARFGRDSFDLVVSTEMLEHVADWRLAVANLKAVVRPGGLVLLTTRSRGFPYHGYPYDFWRFEVEDLHRIFSDFEPVLVEPDPEAPGVLAKATKPGSWQPADLQAVSLHSILTGRREPSVEAVVRRLAAIREAEGLALPA